MNYENIYYKIINKALSENRIKNSDSYFEEHHILPRALGGSDEKENKVLLTGREHFICHWLLWLFLKGQQKYKMGHAFSRMRYHSSGNRYYSSRGYSTASKAAAASASFFHKGKKLTEEQSENRKKGKNPNAKKIIIRGIEFNSMKEASEYYSLSLKLIRKYSNNEIDEEYLFSAERRKQIKIEKQKESLKKYYEKIGKRTYEEIYGNFKSAELKEKRRQQLKQNPILNNEQCKINHKKSIKKMYEEGYQNPMKGKKKSKKSIEKLKETIKKMYEEGYQNPMKGKKRTDNEKRNKERKWIKNESVPSPRS